jgi:pyruvate dehydrogenase E2 component (dihydrolipoyllysine-residue acetyltransferase)
MATDVIMPALGMAQETGKVLRWLKSEGEQVLQGEALMEVETDKVTVQVEAPADGTLAAVRAAEGEDVPVGRRVALILAPNEQLPDEAAEPVAAPVSEAEAPVRVAVSDGGRERTSAEGGARRPLASPKARRLAAEFGVDLAGLAGSGPHGAVVAADIEAAATTPAASPIPAPAPAEELEVGAVWQRMAERTAESWRTAPHFFLFREVDAGRLSTWRASVRNRAGYESVTVTDLLVKLSAEALRRHPRVNASWHDGTVAGSPDVNVGIAVATADGLVVPVIHAADRLSLAKLAERRGALVAAARDGRLRPDDVTGGTFTVSNLGMYGVDAFLAVLNPPQAAILAVGRIVERVVPRDGAPAVRPTTVLSISFDHRVVDGVRGAEFLDTLTSLVEEPAGLVA